jgi:hypothetical protein
VDQVVVDQVVWMDLMEDLVLMQQTEQLTLVVVEVVDLKKKMQVHLQEAAVVVQV